jgi:uncharacterized membrane protein YoaK (UPF0700 family)
VKPERDTSHLVPLMLALSATTGLIDAVSVLGLGKVFTANMTGNVVFFGFAVAGAPGYAVAPALAALIFFLVGAAIGGRVGMALADATLRRWLLVTGSLEAALLAAAALFAIGYHIATLDPWPSRYAIIALTAVAMGMRNATVRQLKVADLTTTVLTLTLTGLAADSPLGGGRNPNWLRRSAAVLSIVAGAALGAALVLNFGLVPPLLLAAATAFIGSVLCGRR